MIKKRFSVMLVTIGILGMIALIGCGAGDSGDVPAPIPGPVTIAAASIDLLVSNPQLDSQQPTDLVPAPTVTLTAIVKDSSNRALAGKEVSFTADSGLLAVTSGTTDANGTATATLSTGGNPANRVIHLTASTGSVSNTNTVTVTGTTLSISGAASLSFGDSTPLTIFLKDSAGAGIAGRTVTVTSLKGNILSAATSVTNASGQVIVNLTATVGGADKITASAIGATKEFDLIVNTTILTFVNPPPGVVTEIPIETNRSVTVEYISGTSPQAGVAVNFVTTRGTLSSSVATTGADGRATVTVSSTNSGPALLVASVAGGPTAQIAVEFVAPTVFSLTLQASPAVIGPNSVGSETEKSLIMATVRDANDNLVKNKTVTFTIINDASAGSLSPASAITDSFGAASTYFIAGASPGGLDGVSIRASVMGTAVSATTRLTVAKKALFIVLATGPKIGSLEPNKYQQDYVALVTDSAGNPVVGATVVATVTPVYYEKGYFIYPTEATSWQRVSTLEAVSSTLPGIPACANEDGMLHNPLYDFNGILDTNPLTGEKEDQNGNNRLDPGNVASVTAAVTDSTGHGTVSVVYARDYAFWVNVKLEAFANDLKGSTASAYVTFTLPGLAADYADRNVRPPGQPSPFGMSTSCYVDLTVTPVSSSQMTITWQKSVTASSYRVYRNGINIANTTQNTYFDSGLSSGTLYCYQIRTVDAAGTESSFTNTVCNSTFVLPPSSPTATALSSSKIRISWVAMPGATGYRVYRNSDTLPLTSVASTSVVDSGLTADTSYCYAVSSFNAAGESAKSSQVCATTRLAGPPTPTQLTATGSAGPPPKVTLTWFTSTGAASYRIYRDGIRISPTFAGSQATDTNVMAQTWYCYTISAADASGNESDQSTPVCTSTGSVALPTPADLKALPSLGPPPKVTLTWTASAGAASYRIYRDGTLISPAFAGSQATDTAGLVAQTNYCYAISAVDSSGNESTRSPAVCTSIGPPGPPTPTGLTATAVAGPKVNLAWTASAGAVVYNIYRTGGAGAVTMLVPAPAVTATDATVLAGTVYCYKITAFDSSNTESAQSAQVCVTTQSAAGPPAPTGLTVAAISPTQIQVSWVAVAGSAGYKIYRDGTLLTSVTSTSYTDAGLDANTVYCYAVSSFDAAGTESAKTAQLCATTQLAAPPTPTGLVLVVAAGPTINVTWNRSAGAAFYNVYKKTGAALPVLYRAVPDPGVGLTATTGDTVVTAGISYCYTVSAVNSLGNESPQTTQICIAP